MSKWYELTVKDRFIGIITFLVLIIPASFLLILHEFEGEPLGKDGTYYITYDIPNSYELDKYDRLNFFNKLQSKGYKVMPYYLASTYTPGVYDSTAFLIGNIISGNDTIEACIRFESNKSDEFFFQLWSFYGNPIDEDSNYHALLRNHITRFNSIMEKDSLAYQYDDYDSEEN